MTHDRKPPWVPKMSSKTDLAGVNLSSEEMLVLSQVDGALGPEQLVSLTGLDVHKLDGVLSRLVAHGMLEKPIAPAAVVPAAVEGLPPPSAAPARKAAPAPVEDLAPTPPAKSDEDAEALPETEDNPEEEKAEGEDATAAATAPLDEANHRKMYEQVYLGMPKDQRFAQAQQVSDPALLTLCLDPDPQVIKAVLDNPHANISHARMVATHHKTHTGLEALASKSALLTNREVQRLLLGNDQLPETVFHKILDRRRLRDIYKTLVDKNVPEKTRVRARHLLRNRFPMRDPEERAELILVTEGRTLNLLLGLALDSKTSGLICGRTLVSTLLVQNLARFPGANPALLTHLFKQQLVQRTPQLRQMLLQHPNMPSDVKRRGYA